MSPFLRLWLMCERVPRTADRATSHHSAIDPLGFRTRRPTRPVQPNGHAHAAEVEQLLPIPDPSDRPRPVRFDMICGAHGTWAI